MLGVPNNQCGLASHVSCISLEIRVDSDLREDIQFFEVARRLLIRCSREQMNAIVKGVNDIAKGAGDYCIGVDQNVLWFWWYPKSARHSAK